MNNIHPVFEEILSAFATPMPSRIEAARREDAASNRIRDLESIMTDLKAAHATAELLDDCDDLAAELDALWAKFSTKLEAVEKGFWP